jgi:hypothetical protein
LVPFLRVRRDSKLIRRLVRAEHPQARQVAHWHPTSRWDLIEARAEGRLFDPAIERFQSRQTRSRSLGKIDWQASEYLYSPHQLLLVPLLKKALPFLRWDDGKPRIPDIHKFWTDELWPSLGAKNRELAVALSALDPIYHPDVVRRLSLPSREDFTRYDRWRQKLPLTQTLRWLDVEAHWLKDAGATLLHEADGIDPLRDWVKIVREAHPQKWTRLRGDALSAIDLRIAAEVLLRYYDHLARGRRAKPIPPNTSRSRGEFDNRLKPQRDVDGVLTDFGLSPHPSLVLVVEGETEAEIIPRLLAHFGIRNVRDFIAIENAQGVGRDIRPLLAYAVAPRVERERGSNGEYLDLIRPLTRILVVMDAEGAMATAADRAKRRESWIERLIETLPREFRTSAVRDALDRQVYVDTWKRSGASFEFAHFTDRQIAVAADRIDRRTRKPDVARLATLIAACRQRHGNLKDVIPVSKVRLAEELWPTLEQRVSRAEAKGTGNRIPVVRVLDRAVTLASELPRRGLVLEL